MNEQNHRKPLSVIEALAQSRAEIDAGGMFDDFDEFLAAKRRDIEQRAAEIERKRAASS